MILPTWFDYLAESFFYKRSSVQVVRPHVKISFPTVENVNKTLITHNGLPSHPRRVSIHTCCSNALCYLCCQASISFILYTIRLTNRSISHPHVVALFFAEEMILELQVSQVCPALLKCQKLMSKQLIHKNCEC